MASILFISQNGDGIPLGLRLASEGHIVKFWFSSAKAKASLEGFKNPSKVSDPRKMLEQYDLVLADMVKNGKLCDELAARGKLVLGGSVFCDKLELDREYGAKVARALTKTKQPHTTLLKTTSQLQSYVDRAEKRLVIKPLGNKEVSLTLVSNDENNIFLKSVVKMHGDRLVPCVVQDVVDGIEISTEGWFNGKSFVKPFNHTIENKRFLVGNVGPNTGCMGNVVWTTDGDKLTEYTVEPLAPLLEKVGYVGPIDVNCIVDENNAWFLEYTARFGYDAIQTFVELLRIPLFDFLYGIATRHIDEVPVYRNEKAIGVRLSLSPYPSEKGTEQWRGIQVLDVPEAAKRHVWLSDVMLKDERYAVAGVDGVVGCVTARGDDARECRRRAYRTIKNITLSNDVQYREDIGIDVDDKIQKLTEWGWLK